MQDGLTYQVSDFAVRNAGGIDHEVVLEDVVDVRVKVIFEIPFAAAVLFSYILRDDEYSRAAALLPGLAPLCPPVDP